jgi:hypothetical protein
VVSLIKSCWDMLERNGFNDWIMKTFLWVVVFVIASIVFLGFALLVMSFISKGSGLLDARQFLPLLFYKHSHFKVSLQWISLSHWLEWWVDQLLSNLDA